MMLLGRAHDLEKLAELCRSGAAVLLVARPEIGRSVFLRELAQRLQADGTRVHLLGPGRTIHDLIEALGTRAEHPTRPESLAAAVRRGLPPSVLLADDVERLDSLTQRTLQQLAMLTPPGRTSWLFSVTSNEGWPRCQRYELQPLSDKDLSLLIPADEHLVRLAGGSPRQLLALSKLGPGLTLDQLDDEALHVLYLAVLADEPFTLDLLHRASGMSQDAFDHAVFTLKESGLLEDGRVGPPQIKNQSLPDRVRRQLHAKLAEALEGGSPAQRGRHLARAGKSSDAAWLLLEGARQAQSAGQLQEALQLYDAAAGSMLLGDPTVGVPRAETLLAMERADEAEQALKRLNESPELLPARIDVLLAKSDWDGADQLCRGSDHPQVLIRKARIEEHRGNRAEAIACLERAGPQARLELGRLCLKSGDMKRLKVAVEPLLEDAQTRFEALMLLGEAAQLGGRGTAGRERMEEAAALAAQQKLPEREAAVRLRQARGLQAEGDLAWATDACQRAVELLRPGGEGPALSEALELLGRLRLEQNQPQEAEQLFREAGAGLSLGRLMLKEKRADDAVGVLTEAAEHGDVEALVELADTTRDPATAAQAVEAARPLDKPDLLGKALVIQGELAVARKDWPLALESLQQAHCLISTARLNEALARMHEQGARNEVPGMRLSEAQRFRKLARPQRPPGRFPWVGLVAAILLAIALTAAFWPRPDKLVQASPTPTASSSARPAPKKPVGKKPGS